MSDHKCLGLSTCPDHPKWHIVGARGFHGYYWLAYAPYIRRDAGFGTWQEAFDYAHEQASRDHKFASAVYQWR